MNYHIMVDTIFTDGFIDDAEKVSEKNKNRYFVRGVKKSSVYVNHFKAEWIKDIWSRSFRAILSNITIQDKIIIHWYDLNIGKLILTINKNIPLYVVFWGGEFYEDPFPYHINRIHDKITLQFIRRTFLSTVKWPKHPVRILKKLWWILDNNRVVAKEFEVKKQTIHRIDYLLLDSNLFSGDYEKIKDLYGVDHINCLPFVYDQNFDKARKQRIIKLKNKETTVLIGNSATESNNHVDCLDMLKKFNNEQLKLILPLSYGTKKYSAFVQKFCNTEFPNKCEFLNSFMGREEYINKLNEVDIAIMFHNRSQAFGNCITLLTLGKKLYLKNNNPFWQLFNKIGVLIFDASTIKDIAFEEFKKPLSEDQIQSNIQNISNLFSDKNRLEYLSKILN
jgi:dTDP-N-acetylfucosamine:lipid II N-acetylfucosaminyltransferase